MGASGTTQTMTTDVDPAYRSQWDSLYRNALDYVDNTSYQPYGGPLVAGQDQFSSAAQSYLTNGLGLGGMGLNYQAPQLGGPYQSSWNYGDWGSSPGSRKGKTGGGYVTGGPTGDPTNDPSAEDPSARDWARITQQQPYELNAIVEEDPSNNPFGGIGGTGAAGAWQNQMASQGAAQLGAYTPQTVNPTTAQYAGDVNAQTIQANSGLGGIASYMNPYTSDVIDTALSDIDRSRQIANQAGARSAGASTYGGDRNAIIEAETNRNYGDLAARTAAQLRSQGFDTALKASQTDADRALLAASSNQGTGLQASLANQGALGSNNQFNAALGLQGQTANQQAGLQGGALNLGAYNALNQFGNDAFSNMLTGAGALNQMGLQNQLLSQGMIDADRSQFYEARDYPLQQFGLLQSVLTGMPVGLNQTQFTPGNTGAGILGGALGGAGIGSAFGPWGAGIGALGGGILGAF